MADSLLNTQSIDVVENHSIVVFVAVNTLFSYTTLAMSTTRSSIASKTTFDFLAVDSGEETEGEEEIPEPPARLVF